MAAAQDAYKCRTAAGFVYQDQPCKASPPEQRPAKTVTEQQAASAPTSDTQTRLERDKKYLDERAAVRKKTEANDLVTQCEREVYYLQAQANEIANLRLAEYIPNRVGIAQMQLDETRRQTELSNAQAKVESKRHECDARRKDAERVK